MANSQWLRSGDPMIDRSHGCNQCKQKRCKVSLQTEQKSRKCMPDKHDDTS
jgi:hypothetical protein